MFYFYIFRCQDGSLYCGSARDLNNREQAHNAGNGSKYIYSRGGGKIVYSEIFKSLSEALKREIEVKKFSRQKKLELIKDDNKKK